MEESLCTFSLIWRNSPLPAPMPHYLVVDQYTTKIGDASAFIFATSLFTPGSYAAAAFSSSAS